MVTSAARRILVVEDHPDLVLMMCEGLRLKGHTCETATSASKALQSVATFQPEIILLEWALQDRACPGLARALREQSKIDVVIIALSALPAEEFGEHHYVDAYLVKPASIDSIQARIELLGAIRARRN